MKTLFTLFFFGISLSSFSQKSLKTLDILNKNLLYSFGEHKIAINISSDSTIFWKVLAEPKEANEKSRTVHINDHTIITAWYESDKTFVSMYSDFEKMLTNAMICTADGRLYPITGTIQVIK